ncbi:hypothetical protein, partial [Streptococcus mitis]|uniref:hypothetical protein n=1 Tax=Streptococcus mitis TaxID=28037 RepID=UPI0021B5ECF7
LAQINERFPGFHFIKSKRPIFSVDSSTSGISFCPVTLKLNSGYIFLSRLSNHFLTIHSEMTLPVIVISNGARITVTKISKNSPPN